jgi:anti-sigma-K factor RskA
MSEHEELESLIAAWVLGAVEADEVDVVRTHIEGCPTCREMALRLGRTVGALPLDVEEITPPARLRERILAAAATSRGSVAVPARTLARTRDARQAPRPKTVSGRPRGVLPAYAAAASLVLALVVGLVAGDLIGREAPTSAPVVRSALVGHQGLAGARANVIDLKTDGVALVDFGGLPQLDSGKVYEIWLITAGGRADPAGVFVPDSNGSKFVLVSRSLAGYSQMAVTSEVGPAGTLAPTQQPELYGNLA